MPVSRRTVLGVLSALTAGFIPVVKARNQEQEPLRTVLGHRLHDDVSVSLLKSYARSLALQDESARWQAQVMFHEAQLARGGTLGHKFGSRHLAFLKAHESGQLSVDEVEQLRR